MVYLKKNVYGFSAVEVMIAVVVLGLVGTVGFFVLKHGDSGKTTVFSETQKSMSQKKAPANTPSQSTAKPAAVVDPTKGWTTVAPKNTDNTFIVKVPPSLLPSGSCKTKEVLLAITYNTSSADYDCSGLTDGLQYASIVFGISAKSVISSLGATQSSEKVTLADGKTVATKSVITATVKGGGGSYSVRYAVYEAAAPRTGNNSYAVYKTGVGFADENKFIGDFEAAVTKGWSLP